MPPPAGPKPELEQALQGYVAGWNAWLREVGGAAGIPDPTCRGKGPQRRAGPHGRSRRTVREARGTGRPRISVARVSGKPARVVIRIRRGGRVVRRLGRRAATVAVSPRVPNGTHRVDVTVGRRTVRLSAKQR